MKERKNMYFVQSIEREDIYSQWETPEQAVKNLLDAYELVTQREKERKKIIISTTDHIKWLGKSDFKSIIFSL